MEDIDAVERCTLTCVLLFGTSVKAVDILCGTRAL